MGITTRKLTYDESLEVGPVVDVSTPTQKELMGAAFRTENIYGSWLATKDTSREYEAVEGYNVYPDLPEKYLDNYGEDFANVRSPGEAEMVMANIDREEADRQTRAEGGWSGLGWAMAAGMIGPVETPLMFLGGWGAAKTLANAPRYAKVAGFTSYETGVVGAMEVALHETQHARTWQESLAAMGGAAVLSAAGAGFVTRDAAKWANDIQGDLQDNARTAGTIDLDSPNAESTVGAAQAYRRDLEGEGSAITDAGSKQWRGLAPLVRGMNSPSVTMRTSTNDLNNHNIYLGKYARVVDELDADGNPVGKRVKYERPEPALESERETWMDGYSGRTGPAISDAYKKYSLSHADKRSRIRRFVEEKAGAVSISPDEARLTETQFSQEVGKAMRRNDEHEIPEVVAMSKMYRAEFDKVTKEFQEMKVLPDELTADYADSYFPRLYNIDKIENDYENWIDTVSEVLRKNDPGLDVQEARDLAAEITNNITNTDAGMLARDIIPQSGRTKSRVLPIRDEILEPWLLSDVQEVGEAFMRSTVPEVLARRYSGGLEFARDIDQASAFAKMDADELMTTRTNAAKQAADDVELTKRELDQANENLSSFRDDLNTAETQYTSAKNAYGKAERAYGKAKGVQESESKILNKARADVRKMADKARLAFEKNKKISEESEGLGPIITKLRSGKIPTDRQIYGESLAEMMAERGISLRGEGGELTSRDLNKAMEFEGLGVRRIAREKNSAGRPEPYASIDDAAEAARERGFIKSDDPDELLEAIARDLADGGESRRLVGQEDGDLAALRARIESFGDWLDELGIDVDGKTNAQVLRKLFGSKVKIGPKLSAIGRSGRAATRQTKRVNVARGNLESAQADLKKAKDRLNQSKSNANASRAIKSSAEARIDLAKRNLSAAKKKRVRLERAVAQAKAEDIEPKTAIEAIKAEANRAWRGEDVIDGIKDDYNILIERAKGTKGSAKRIKALRENMKSDISDYRAMNNRFMYRPAVPATENRKLANLSQWARSLSFMANLGMMTVSAVPDMAKIVAENGLLRTLKMTGRGPLSFVDNKIKGNVKQLRAMGVGVDLITNGRIYAMTGGMETMTKAQQRWTASFSRFTLMNHWNTTLKTIAAQAAQDRIISIAKRLQSGQRVSKKWFEKMARAGFDPDDLQKIAEMPTEKVQGAWLANTAEWPDVQLARRFELALKADVDRTIVTPGIGDKPIFMDSETGKILMQFKSFFISSHTQTMLPLAQKLSRGELEAMNSVITGALLGIFTEWTRAHLSGREAVLENYQLRDWVSAGVDRSGMVTIPFEMFNMLDKASYGTIRAGLGLQQPTRYMYRNIMGSLMGPVAGYGESAIRALQNVSNGEITENDLHSIRRIIPYQNLFYLRRLFDKAEKGLADVLGLEARDQ